MAQDQQNVNKHYEKTMDNVLKRFADSKGDEGDDMEYEGKTYNQNP